MDHDDHTKGSTLFVSSRQFFEEMVSDALVRRKVKTLPLAKSYLVELLEFYVPTANFFDDYDSSGKRTRETLAETFLKAQNSEPSLRQELLKKMADRSLYISGFFGDSLQRKLIDIDYYADMGGAAYGALADSAREDLLAKVYSELARRFLEFAEVLTYISSQARLHDEQNILRLYEHYARTGSDFAREKLLERGLIAVPMDGVESKDRKKQ